jgi:hypothetical protein
VRGGNETATSDFGHSCARVPEWLHIGPYPHAFPNAVVCGARYKIPANNHIRCRSGLEGSLIAMQKVEGSNPFSRFARNLALGRDFVVYEGARGK